MRFIYLIAAYNERAILPGLIDKFKELRDRNISFEVFVIDNGSSDGSAEILNILASENHWLHPVFTNNKGLGFAFKKGLLNIEHRKFSSSDWIVFSAADLPFNFSDLDSFLQYSAKFNECDVFLGSKYHKKSQIKTSLKRLIGSIIFFGIRLLILQLNVKDTQGTIFLRAQKLNIYKKIKSNDYFFTTELIYNLKPLTPIIEMPVVYQEGGRPSRVNLAVDGFKSFLQLVKLRSRSSRF